MEALTAWWQTYGKTVHLKRPLSRGREADLRQARLQSLAVPHYEYQGKTLIEDVLGTYNRIGPEKRCSNW